MAGNFKGRGGRGFKKPKSIGRGVFSCVTTDGPHTEWLGMPPYYIHQLTIDDIKYTYFSPDEKITIELGKTVTFRFRETKKGKVIDKNSLGVVIDPSEL
jgi:hypothetical protein